MPSPDCVVGADAAGFGCEFRAGGRFQVLTFGCYTDSGQQRPEVAERSRTSRRCCEKQDC